MSRQRTYQPEAQFENLFRVLSSPRFLKKEGLGGELPFFIHSFPIQEQCAVEVQVSSLIKRLQTHGVDVLEINLYLLCIDILKQGNLLNQIMDQESKTQKARLLRALSGPLNIDTVLLPEINRILAAAPFKMIFLTGVGAAYPFIRSHTILNNVQTLVGDLPLVLFFPGTYNNQSLTLFDRLKDENYYRAHNLNEYKV